MAIQPVRRRPALRSVPGRRDRVPGRFRSPGHLPGRADLGRGRTRRLDLRRHAHRVPYPVGEAAVYKISGGVPVAVESGFTNIIDIAFGPDGSLYVLEIAKAGLLETGQDGLTRGRLVRVRPDRSREVVSGPELRSPGGVAVDADGHVYVSNQSTRPGSGQVLRYTLR
ncbi:MAG: ScyD/ScyE family protein [Acidimicrobiales bacterium]